MNTTLVAIVYTLVAIVAAFVVTPRDKGGFWLRVALAWATVTATIFFIRDQFIAVLISGVIVAVLSPKGLPNRVAFYIAVLPSVPDFIAGAIPFPGLNYLTVLNFSKATAIAILGPAFLTALSVKRSRSLAAVDVFVLLFFIFSSLLTMRSLPITSVLRMLIDQFLLIYLPYITISRALSSFEDIDLVIRAFFFSLFVVAGIAAISALQSWNYYHWINPGAGFLKSADFRNGFLRTGATLTTPLVAQLMAVLGCTAYHFWRTKVIGIIFAAPTIGLALFAAFVTGSRGGWLGAIVVVCGYLTFRYLGGGLRRFFVVGVIGTACYFVHQILTDPNFMADDGNITYRANLMRASVQQMWAHPLFGDANYRESPIMLRMVQGQGIVDMVNLYLILILTYGLVGFFLWLTPLLLTLNGVLKRFEKFPTKKDGDVFRASLKYKSAAAILMGGMLGYMTMILTTSFVSYIWQYYYLLLALLVALARLPADETEHEDKDIPSSDDDSNRTEQSLMPAQRLPYGARHVRVR